MSMRATAALVLFAILLVPGCAQLRGPGSDAKLEIPSYALVHDATGLRLVGEVVNRGTTNADAIRLEARFLDAQGHALSSAQAAAWRRVLEPGEASPFDIPAPAGAVDANLTALGESTHQPSYERQQLAARDVTARADPTSTNVTFQGTAVNGGDLTVVAIQAQLTFRDASGKVVGVARADTRDPAIRAGEGSPFSGNATLAAPYARFDTVVVTLATPG